MHPRFSPFATPPARPPSQGLLLVAAMMGIAGAADRRDKIRYVDQHASPHGRSQDVTDGSR